jgi:transketolase
MRNAFIKKLIAAAEANDRIVLMVGDLGYGVIEEFARRFPNRFFNAGVAEQNMMGMAAGLASEGFHVFVYSIANFPTFRCAEQIRNDVDYHNLPVTIVSVGGGLAYGNLGYSHHAVQDFGLIRLMPNMLIAAPGDPMEVQACMEYLINHPQPSYLRLGKAGEPCIHKSVPIVEPGVWLNVHESKENIGSILTTGATLELAHGFINQERTQTYSLYTLPLWGMAFKEKQASQARLHRSVITIEDHLLDCGFGSWMMESLSSQPDLLAKIRIRALDQKICGMVGKQSTLNSAGGLTQDMLCG